MTATAMAGVRTRTLFFVAEPAPGDTICVRLQDPATVYVVERPASAEQGAGAASPPSLTVAMLVPAEGAQGFADWLQRTGGADTSTPIAVKYRGVELIWRRGQAVLQCEAEQADGLLAALAEFEHCERELALIEEEIAHAWPEVEQDTALAFDVTPRDLRGAAALGQRMQHAFRRRIRYARLEPHLYLPDAALPPSAVKLGEELREKAHLESRSEIVDGQMEVFEHIYEMSSQRMGEFRAARQGHLMEWVIVVLLAAEALLMLAQTVFLHVHG